MLFQMVTRLTRGQKQVAFVLLDAVTVLAAVMLVRLLDGAQTLPDTPAPWLLGTVLAIWAAVLGWVMGLTRSRLNAYEARGVTHTVIYALALGTAHLGLSPVLGGAVPPVAHVTFVLLVMVLSAGWRVTLRQLTHHIYLSGPDTLRVLIYGAGTAGQQLQAALRHARGIRIVGFIDDNPTLQSQVVAGLRVFGPSRLPQLVADRRVDRIVLAMPDASAADVARLRQRLRHLDAEVHALPCFAALVREGLRPAQGAPVPVADLLGRSGLERELPGVSHSYLGQRILVTGAGGSIGSELCRQLLSCEPERIVLVDHSELALYTIEKELRSLIDEGEGPGPEIEAVLGSVLDADLMTRSLRRHEIDVVLHAAAYKHVPMVEANPLAGLQNNVLGTRVMAEAARACSVARFILISSDKAVRPTNVMGASKRLAELVVQDLAARSEWTVFSMVRFGNVLGSSGSVVPLFEEQIARGGPVTLTHPEVTRYFMTIPEAVRLVLLTGSFARGGDVFVLDMGDPVPIARIAAQMIEGAGYTVRDAANPDGDIEIAVTGLRPGEKLHEELLISCDMLTTPHPKIRRAQEDRLSEFEVATALKELRLALETRDEAAARAMIARWVEPAPADGARTGLA
ncbi:polysaccharide biosynthesis protein [Sagittula salina]|uniref:Polysaccharide biosynthesis protein n=1 Tax=Sagittula salina TaxID=2820268 RepID=A0A940MMT7_9RHOB|nr:nucleoside-diphosphate sugar epimerase/dehydratase [Sagittula salina]MBP0482413.1 polysaccharide biosynthesis protein [Sagittula salina]